MNIPIREAIDAGAWLDCTSDGLNYRFKITSFYSPRLEFEIVSLNKQPVYGRDIADTILLVDQWGYEFYHVDCDFEGIYILNPKLKYVGTMWYRLPEEDAEYYLSVKGADVKEV